jgi:hypothetical protein
MACTPQGIRDAVAAFTEERGTRCAHDAEGADPDEIGNTGSGNRTNALLKV